jgi:hypothetical protein
MQSKPAGKTAKPLDLRFYPTKFDPLIQAYHCLINGANAQNMAFLPPGKIFA